MATKMKAKAKKITYVCAQDCCSMKAYAAPPKKTPRCCGAPMKRVSDQRGSSCSCC